MLTRCADDIFIVHVKPRAYPEFFIGGKTEGQDWGMGFLGGAAHSPPARDLGEHCELPQQCSGQIPDCPKVYHYFQHSGRPLLTL